MNRQVLTIEDVCLRVTSGGTPSRRVSAFFKGDIPWLKTQELRDTWVYETEEHITRDAVNQSSAKLLPAHSVMMAMYGATVGKLAILGSEMTCNQAACAMIVDPDKADYRYLYYSLLNDRARIVDRANGAAQQNLSARAIKALEYSFPPIEEQRVIVATLGALDDKIESNRLACDRILGLANLTFVAALERGRRQVTVADVADFHNRRRIPLSSKERSQRAGNVPYYGATGIFGYVNESLFDEILVLVGEDGSVVRDDGGPVLQYIWGPAWINNHAHPLTGRGISNETLYLALDRSDIRPIVTGAVQPKVNMRNLKSLPLELPTEAEAMETELAHLFEVYRARQSEILQLAELRDTLLPQLISGDIRVRDEEGTA